MKIYVDIKSTFGTDYKFIRALDLKKYNSSEVVGSKIEIVDMNFDKHFVKILGLDASMINFSKGDSVVFSNLIGTVYFYNGRVNVSLLADSVIEGNADESYSI
ncbi:MAG: hypothetical protein ABF526_12035 [Liquorilactobacillus nagelii]|uniref:hypothetical protein n=1 Tax=Liquorilactobacillus nagelii TaxID=82688 RepID=UPI0039E9B699